MNNNPTLYFVFGPSGAGKSYFCERMQDATTYSGKTCLHITSDHIRDNYAKEQFDKNNPIYIQSEGIPVYTKTEANIIFSEMQKQIIEGLNKGYDVISDRVITSNELKEKIIKKFIFNNKIEKNVNLDLIQITNSKSNCFKNVEKRNKENVQTYVPTKTVRVIYNNYERITPEIFNHLCDQINSQTKVSISFTDINRAEGKAYEYNKENKEFIQLTENEYLKQLETSSKEIEKTEDTENEKSYENKINELENDED